MKDVKSEPLRSAKPHIDATDAPSITAISPTQEKREIDPAFAPDVEMSGKRFTRYVHEWRERARNGELPSARDLLVTFESFQDPTLNREEAMRALDALADRAKAARTSKGHEAMARTILSYIYNCRYDVRENTMLGLFTGSKSGNCDATAKGVTAILEEVGLNPETEIAYQLFSDHVCALAKFGKAWYVMEGINPHPLQSKDTIGTSIVSAADIKRGFLGIKPTSSIELGTAAFYQEDGETRDSGITQWIKKGLKYLNEATRVKRRAGSLPYSSTNLRSANRLGIANVEALITSFLPFRPSTRKTVTRALAALTFLYATDRCVTEQPKNLKEVTEVVHKDIQMIAETASSVVKEIMREVTQFASGEGGEKKKTRMELPGSMHGAKQPGGPRMDVELATTEIEKRMERYYGLAHFLLTGDNENKIELAGPEDDMEMVISVQSEATHISDDLFRYMVSWGKGHVGNGLPRYMIFRFEGENLYRNASAKVLQDLKERIEDAKYWTPDFVPDTGYDPPLTSSIDIHINGRHVGEMEPDELQYTFKIGLGVKIITPDEWESFFKDSNLAWSTKGIPYVITVDGEDLLPLQASDVQQAYERYVPPGPARNTPVVFRQMKKIKSEGDIFPLPTEVWRSDPTPRPSVDPDLWQKVEAMKKKKLKQITDALNRVTSAITPEASNEQDP